MTRVFRLVVLGLTCSLLPGAAAAQATQSAADTKELEAYRLTLDRLNAVVAINRSVVQAMMKDPKLQQAMKTRQELETLQAKDELTEADERRMEELETALEQIEDDELNPLGGESRSLAEMEARIRKFPVLMQALKQQGMAPREYAKFWLVFIQAAFAHGFQKSGMLKELPPGVNPENVKFIGDHAAEMEAIQKEFEALGGLQP